MDLAAARPRTAALDGEVKQSMRVSWTSIAAVTAAVVFLVSAGGVALADLEPGTQVYATLQGGLDTKTAKVNDPVMMTVTSLYPQTALNTTIQGATVKGHVIQAHAASPTKKATIQIAFDQITLADGRSFPFPAKIDSMQKSKHTNYAQAAGEVLGGMVVGNVLGKWTGAQAGGVVGAAGGALYASQMSQNFAVAANTTIKLETTDAIPITATHPRQR